MRLPASPKQPLPKKYLAALESLQPDVARYLFGNSTQAHDQLETRCLLTGHCKIMHQSSSILCIKTANCPTPRCCPPRVHYPHNLPGSGQVKALQKDQRVLQTLRAFRRQTTTTPVRRSPLHIRFGGIQPGAGLEVGTPRILVLPRPQSAAGARGGSTAYRRFGACRFSETCAALRRASCEGAAAKHN